MSELLLGVDLGTTGTKTALFTAEGEPLSEAMAATPLRWRGLGEVDQDPDDFYRAATGTIARCLQRANVRAESVAAIGVTGQMAGVLGVDRDWQPSMPYDSWLDLRCSPDVEFLEHELADELVARTGCPAMVNHAPKLRWWRREHPETFTRTAKFVMPGGYVAGKLAGLKAADAFIDRTYLHFTGLADAKSGAWSQDLAQVIGVPEHMLPSIVEPSTVIGHLTAQAAAACGLRSGIPVAAGLGDTAAGALGAGIVHPRQLLDTAGTAAVFAASTPTFQPDRRNRTLIVMRGALKDQWIALSYLSGGSLLAWFQSAVGAGPDEVRSHPPFPTSEDAGRGPTLPAENVNFDELTAGLEQIPAGSAGLLFVPHLDGRILPSEPAMRGAWVGLHRYHGRAHLARAILESVAYEYAGYLRVLLELHPELQPDETRVIGGGARSAIWNRIKSSVLGIPFVRLNRAEFSCWGAALVAGHAVGMFDDLALAATTSTALAERYQPDPEEHATYAQMADQYYTVLAALTAPSKALAALQSQGSFVKASA